MGVAEGAPPGDAAGAGPAGGEASPGVAAGAGPAAAPVAAPAGGEAGRIADSLQALIKKRPASVLAAEGEEEDKEEDEEEDEEEDDDEDDEEDDERPKKTKAATKGKAAAKAKGKAAAKASAKATAQGQSARNNALAQFKRAKGEACIVYRGCTIRDRRGVMKIRGFIPKALAPGASDGQRDFTRQYGTQLNPGDAARKETTFRRVLDTLDATLE